MEKIITGHLTGFGTLKEIEELREDYYGEFTDAGMTVRRHSAYDGVPSKEECDQLCAELSGEVITYKRNTKG